MKKQILIAGGAGYIGSHTAMALEKAGYDALVFDNLSAGHTEFLRFGRHIIGDLADAHILALERLLAGGESCAFNLGNGKGYSVHEVIACARAVSGGTIAVKDAPRRSGDPDCLVGDAQKAVTELGWKPRYADLETIIRTAWEWELFMAERAKKLCV
jgi:UDP-glucose 4-epimerase